MVGIRVIQQRSMQPGTKSPDEWAGGWASVCNMDAIKFPPVAAGKRKCTEVAGIISGAPAFSFRRIRRLSVSLHHRCCATELSRSCPPAAARRCDASSMTRINTSCHVIIAGSCSTRSAIS